MKEFGYSVRGFRNLALVYQDGAAHGHVERGKQRRRTDDRFDSGGGGGGEQGLDDDGDRKRANSEDTRAEAQRRRDIFKEVCHRAIGIRCFRWGLPERPPSLFELRRTSRRAGVPPGTKATTICSYILTVIPTSFELICRSICPRWWSFQLTRAIESEGQ